MDDMVGKEASATLFVCSVLRLVLLQVVERGTHAGKSPVSGTERASTVARVVIEGLMPDAETTLGTGVMLGDGVTATAGPFDVPAGRAFVSICGDLSSAAFAGCVRGTHFGTVNEVADTKAPFLEVTRSNVAIDGRALGEGFGEDNVGSGAKELQIERSSLSR